MVKRVKSKCDPEQSRIPEHDERISGRKFFKKLNRPVVDDAEILIEELG